ncbi:hypothetical protein BDR26DRAFT_859356, partial [Obelidium mucronatum]
ETASSSSSSSESSLSIKQPHLSRKRRWEELNKILSQNKKMKASGSVGYSYVTWNDVKSVFKTSPFVLPIEPLPNDAFELLTKYLAVATRCFGPITTGKEAQRLHFIAPILICVSNLFNGDVTIEVEEDMDGDILKANGHFEFVMRRGNKRGMAQDLLGCEVAAELDNLDEVMGIVTNYIQWNFLRSLDERIDLEECSLELADGGHPTPESLMRIAGKIYGMLKE